MKVNANEIKFLLLFFGCKTSPLHCQMGTQSADIQHLSTDYTSIGKKLQQCVNHVSMCPLRWCFICIWLCISTIQPWSNIKVSQPVRWLVISHCVIWRLRVCVCVCAWCWHCHHRLEAAVHLWQKDLCSQADHPPKGLAWRNRNYWVHSFPQHKDINTIFTQRVTAAQPTARQWRSTAQVDDTVWSSLEQLAALMKLANMNWIHLSLAHV